MIGATARPLLHEFRCRKCGLLFFTARLSYGTYVKVVCHRSKCKEVNIFTG